MKSIAWVLLGVLLLGTAECSAQCRWCPDSTERYTTIRSATIKKEVISFIDWVWEYEGTSRKPTMLHLKGKSDCDTYAHFKGHGVDVRIESAPFDSTKHTLTFTTDGYPALCKIDGRIFCGTDGSIPQEEIKNVAVTIDSVRIDWPRSAWADLYQPNFCFQTSEGFGWEVNVARSMDRKRVYVHMFNSDGAGGYMVIWIFINGRYVRRVIEGPP